MAFLPFSPILAQASGWFAGAVHRLESVLGIQHFTPEVDLRQTPGVDPRLVPRAGVRMDGADVDANLLQQLSAMGLRHGKLMTAESHPELVAQFAVLSARAGLKHPPQLILVENKNPNAMTVSPEEMVVTTGLFKLLDLREVCAVLGHELGHAVSEHAAPRVAASAVFGLGGGVAGNIAGSHLTAKYLPESFHGYGVAHDVAWFSAGAAVGQVVANQVSVRPTELQADIKGAVISGDPEGLISALQKLGETYAKHPVRTAIGYVRSGYPTMDQRIENIQRVAGAMQAHPLESSVVFAPGNQVSNAVHEMGQVQAKTSAPQMII